MAKAKADGHIWGLEINRYACFSFCGNRTIFGWDIANSMLDLDNSKSRSWPRSKPMVTFEAQSSINRFAFYFVAIGPFLAEIEQIPYLTLKIVGQSHDDNRPKSNQVIYRSGTTQKWKKSKKLFKSYRVDKSLRPAVAPGGSITSDGLAAAYEPVQKHKVTPGKPGLLYY